MTRFVFDTSLAMLKKGGTGEQRLRERRHAAYSLFEVGGASVLDEYERLRHRDGCVRHCGTKREVAKDSVGWVHEYLEKMFMSS